MTKQSTAKEHSKPLVLYAMYLDKPMRDHTLLQAIARVNKSYENEEKDMKIKYDLIPI